MHKKLNVAVIGGFPVSVIGRNTRLERRLQSKTWDLIAEKIKKENDHELMADVENYFLGKRK